MPLIVLEKEKGDFLAAIYEKQKEIKEEDTARIGSAFLDTDDMFPQLELQLISGEKLKLPKDIGEGYGVVLIYRGHR